MKRVLIIIILIIAFSSTIIISKLMMNRDEEYGTTKFKIIDRNTRQEITRATIIITDLEKKYIIDEKNKEIYLPKKPWECYGTEKCLDKGKYPYGYTIITIADGYLPRIDYNLILGYEDTLITIELTNKEKADKRNHNYEEHFHKHIPNVIYELLDYYDIDI